MIAAMPARQGRFSNRYNRAADLIPVVASGGCACLGVGSLLKGMVI
jgi:hypothetical protein